MLERERERERETHTHTQTQTQTQTETETERMVQLYFSTVKILAQWPIHISATARALPVIKGIHREI